MREIKVSEDAYLDIEEMFTYISQEKKLLQRNCEKKSTMA